MIFILSFLKIILIFTILVSITSRALISVYNSNQKFIRETIDELYSSIKSMDSLIDLYGREISFDKYDGDTLRQGKIFNFIPDGPIFIPFDYDGVVNDIDVTINNENENAFQYEFSFNYTFTQNKTLEQNGTGNIRFITSFFNFRKTFDKKTTTYSMIPILDIKFEFFDCIFNGVDNDSLPLQVFLQNELRTDKKVRELEDDVDVYLDKQVEKYFADNVVEYYEVSLTNKPGKKYVFSLTPIFLPEAVTAINGTETIKGQQNYLDGQVYNSDGTQVEGLDYGNVETPKFKNVFDYTKSNRQVFISHKVFSDLIMVDLMKIGELPVYESEVDLSKIPFRFNVMYLNKFLPGVNQVYSNSQKIYVEIKIKDVIYKYGENIDVENPIEESFVIVTSDVFFITTEKNAGKVLLEISLQTKAFLDVYRPHDTNKFNIKFRENIQIVECIPKNFVGYDFNLNRFLDEFEKSYSITNFGEFNYKLFEHPITLKDLVGENHEIVNNLKGIVLSETQAPRPDLVSASKNNKSLEFLK